METIKEEQARTYAGIPQTIIDQDLQLKKQIAYFENQLINQQNKGIISVDKGLMDLEEKIFQFNFSRQGTHIGDAFITSIAININLSVLKIS